MADLTGKSALAIVTNYGVEQDELLVPVQELREAGAQVGIAAVSSDAIQTVVSDKDPAEQVSPTTTLDDVDAKAFLGAPLYDASPLLYDYPASPVASPLDVAVDAWGYAPGSAALHELLAAPCDPLFDPYLPLQ